MPGRHWPANHQIPASWETMSRLIIDAPFITNTSPAMTLSVLWCKRIKDFTSQTDATCRYCNYGNWQLSKRHNLSVGRSLQFWPKRLKLWLHSFVLFTIMIPIWPSFVELCAVVSVLKKNVCITLSASCIEIQASVILHILGGMKLGCSDVHKHSCRGLQQQQLLICFLQFLSPLR